MILTKPQTVSTSRDASDNLYDLSDLFNLDIRISLPEAPNNQPVDSYTQKTWCGCGTNSCHHTCEGVATCAICSGTC